MSRAEAAGLYRCGCARALPDRGAPALLSGAIDLHCHVLVPEAEALAADQPPMVAIRDAAARSLSETTQRYNASLLGQLVPRLVDITERLADMDALGTAVQVLSPSPTQYHYWADAALSEQLAALQNDRVEALRDAHRDRFEAFGALSLQHPDLAVAQLRELARRGFKGVEVSSRVGERELFDPIFESVWAAAAAAKMVIFLHPLGTSLGSRVADHYLSNIVGQPSETTIALSGLIFAGVLDRHPELRLLAAHGGGYLPAYIGRSDHAHAVRPDSAGCRERPSAYLPRLWYDTVVHDPGVLANLIRVAGADRIVIGSDYPFDMGEYRPAELLDGVPGLGDAEREMIVSGNARRLLGLAETAA